MICSRCQSESASEAKFCSECGAAFARRCEGCGAELAPRAKFCAECGRPAAGDGRSPRAYTPKHLADRILTTRAALEGERKHVTVLFADVKGSMDLAGSVDPEEWHRLLDRFFAILCDGVHRFEGTVNQFTGDGIMALFGAPIAHEDHAQRACHAALHLRRELAAFAAELRRERGLAFSVRLGLHSGEVVVGRIGDDLRMDYTAQGHTVGLAARMEHLAEPGTAYLTAVTAEIVRGFFRLRDLGPFQIPGARDPVRVYELEDLGPSRSRFDVARTRGLSRFVGRDRELACLEAALARAHAGKGSLIGVVADAGTGKSRLCHELAEHCRAHGIEVNRGQAVPHGRSIPFLPVLEMLRSYFAIDERDPPQRAREKVAGRVLLLDENAREGLPFLFDALGVPDPEQPLLRMDPEARERRFLDMIESLVRRRSRGRVAVFVLEDLHWLDAASAAALDRLAACVEETRTLVVLNYRPEYRPPWQGSAFFEEIRLDPLGDEAARELLRDLLGGDPSTAPLAAAILDRTGGNPFFLEETVRALAERGDLAGTRGAHRLTAPVERIRLPESVHGVLAARIDRLGEAEKELAQAAAVIGKEFSSALLEHVTGLTRSQLHLRLERLEEAAIVRPRPLSAEPGWVFCHPLIQEVAYGTQLTERRAQFHARIADALAELHADRRDELAALIAHHREGAGEALEAVRWHQRAAQWTGTRNLTEAHRHWQRMRELLVRVPENEETLWLGLAARAQILNVGWRAGISSDEAAVVFAEGRAIAERSGEPRMLALLLSAYCAVRGFAGDVGESLELAVEAARVAETIDDLESRIVPQLSLIYTHFTAGRLREALTFADQLLASMPEDDLAFGSFILGESPNLFLTWFRGMLLSCLGDARRGLAELDRAIRVGREHHELEIVCSAHVSAAVMSHRIGDAESATEHARRALELAEVAASPLRRVYSSWASGHAAMARGEFEAAAELFERTLTLAHEKRTALSEEAMFRADLAEAEVSAGRIERGCGTAEHAVAVAEQRGTRFFEGQARLVLARALLRTERADLPRARQELELATEIFSDIGTPLYLAGASETAAELAAACGDEQARQDARAETLRLYREVGAPHQMARLTATTEESAPVLFLGRG